MHMKTPNLTVNYKSWVFYRFFCILIQKIFFILIQQRWNYFLLQSSCPPIYHSCLSPLRNQTGCNCDLWFTNCHVLYLNQQYFILWPSRNCASKFAKCRNARTISLTQKSHSPPLAAVELLAGEMKTKDCRGLCLAQVEALGDRLVCRRVSSSGHQRKNIFRLQ